MREPHEYAAGHIDGARLIPPGEIGSGRFDLPKDEAIVLYCRSGRRSAVAGRLLQERGYSEVKHLQSGISGW